MRKQPAFQVVYILLALLLAFSRGQECQLTYSELAGFIETTGSETTLYTTDPAQKLSKIEYYYMGGKYESLGPMTAHFEDPIGGTAASQIYENPSGKPAAYADTLVFDPADEIVGFYAHFLTDKYITGVTFTGQSGAKYVMNWANHDTTESGPYTDILLPISGFRIAFNSANKPTAIQIVHSECPCFQMESYIVDQLPDGVPDMTTTAGETLAVTQLIPKQYDFASESLGLECYGLLVQLTPNHSLVSLVANPDGSHSIELSSDSIHDYDRFTMTLTVEDPSGSLAPLSYTFEVYIAPCDIQITSSPPGPLYLTIESGDAVSAHFDLQQVIACPGQTPRYFDYNQHTFMKVEVVPDYLTASRFDISTNTGLAYAWLEVNPVSSNDYVGADQLLLVEYEVTLPGFPEFMSYLAVETLLTIEPSCKFQIIEPAEGLQDYSYVVDPLEVFVPETPEADAFLRRLQDTQISQFTFPSFTIDYEELCPITYGLNVTPEAPFVTYDGILTVDWSLASLEDSGEYFIELSASGPYISNTMGFTLTIEVGCKDAVLSFTASFQDQFDIFYMIEDPAQTSFNDQQVVTSTHSLDKCSQPVAYRLETLDGSDLDPSLFTWDPLAPELTIQTDDLIGNLDQLEHLFILSAFYSDFEQETLIQTTVKVQLAHGGCEQLPGTDLAITDYSFTLFLPNADHFWTFADSTCGPWVLDSYSGLSPDAVAKFDTGSLVLKPDLGESQIGEYVVEAVFSVFNTDLVETVQFIVTINPCIVAEMTATPVPPQFYFIAESALTFEFQEFKMTPQCSTDPLQYEITVLEQGQEIDFSSFLTYGEARTLTIESDNLDHIGLYTIQVRPYDLDGLLRQEVLEVQLEVNGDECPTSQFDLAAAIPDLFTVPTGQTVFLYEFEEPQDSISQGKGDLEYCGPRFVSLIDADSGAQADLESSHELSYSAPMLSLEVYSDAEGQVVSKDYVLRVELSLYPQVKAFEKRITIQHRVFQEPDTQTEESGFEIAPDFPPLDPLIVNCQNETVYYLPDLRDGAGDPRRFEVSFDPTIQEVTFFYDILNVIYVRAFLLTEKHEGTHLVNVTMLYGGKEFSANKTQELELVIDCYEDPPPQIGPQPQEPPKEIKPQEEVEKPLPKKTTPQGKLIPVEKIYDLSQYTVKADTEEGVWEPEQPQPRLKSVDENGLIVIEWDRKMVVPLDLTRIPSTSYIVYDDKRIRYSGNDSDSSSDRRVRRLARREWFDTNEEFLQYLLIIDALEINVTTQFDDGKTDEIQFTWELVSFEELYMELQVYFERPEIISNRFAEDKIRVTFWGTEFFKSSGNTEVRYGSSVEATLLRQVDPQQAEQNSFIAGLASASLKSTAFGALFMVPLLFLAGRNLLSTWLLLTTMQLVAHMPLLHSLMPIQLLVFLRSFLGVLRLGPKVDTQGAESGALSIWLSQAGYTETSLSENLSTWLKVVSVCAAILMISMIAIDRVYQRERTVSRACLKWRPFCKGVLVCAVYLYAFCYLELVLCALIQAQAPQQGSKFGAWFLLSVASLPLLLVAYCLFKVNALQKVISEEGEDNCPDSEEKSAVITPPSHQKEGEEKQVKEDMQYKEWLEDGDLEQPPTQRGLLDNKTDAVEIKDETPDQAEQQELQALEGGQAENLPQCELSPAEQTQKTQNLKHHHRVRLLIAHEGGVKADGPALYSAVFSGKKLTKSAVAYTLVFGTRVILFCVAITCFETFFAQVVSVLVTCLLSFAFVLHAAPSLWTESKIKYLHLLNESLLWLVCYCNLAFSAFVEIQARTRLGFALMAAVMTVIAVNILVLIHEAYRGLKLRYARWRASQKWLKAKQSDVPQDEAPKKTGKDGEGMQQTPPPESDEVLERKLMSPSRRSIDIASPLEMTLLSINRGSAAVVPLPPIDPFSTEGTRQLDFESLDLETADKESAQNRSVADEFAGDEEPQGGEPLQIEEELTAVLGPPQASQPDQSEHLPPINIPLKKETKPQVSVEGEPQIDELASPDDHYEGFSEDKKLEKDLDEQKAKTIEKEAEDMLQTLETYQLAPNGKLADLHSRAKYESAVRAASQGEDSSEQTHSDNLFQNVLKKSDPAEAVAAIDSRNAGDEDDKTIQKVLQGIKKTDKKKLKAKKTVPKKTGPAEFDPRKFNSYGNVTDERFLKNFKPVEKSSTVQDTSPTRGNFQPRQRQSSVNSSTSLAQQKASKWTLRQKTTRVVGSDDRINLNDSATTPHTTNKMMMGRANSTMNMTARYVHNDNSINEPPKPKTNLFAQTAMKSFNKISSVHSNSGSLGGGGGQQKTADVDELPKSMPPRSNSLYQQRKSVPLNQSKLFQAGIKGVLGGGAPKRDNSVAASQSHVSSLSSATQIHEGGKRPAAGELSDSMADLSVGNNTYNNISLR